MDLSPDVTKSSLVWVDFCQIAFPYKQRARAAGEVKYTCSKLMRLAINGIVSFSTRPLRVATYMGFFVSLISFAGVLFTLPQQLFPDNFQEIGLRPVPGCATTVIAVLFMGGVQLVCRGIVGEYIGRFYENVRGRPQSVLSETFGFVADDKDNALQSLAHERHSLQRNSFPPWCLMHNTTM